MSAAIKLARASSQGGIGTGRNVSRGDPGLFGTIGSVLGGIVGSVIPGVGTAVGAAAGGGLGNLIGGGGSKPKPAPVSFAPTTSYPVVGTPGITGSLQRLLPGGATGYQVNAPAAAASAAGGGCPSGHRPNKSGYFLKSGEYVAPGTRCVKIRRRNPANPRALDRAISRLNAGKRLQHKLAGFSTEKYTSGGQVKKHWGRRS